MDIGSYVFMNILENSDAIDLAYPTFIDDFTLMQRFPNGTNRLDGSIEPFTSTVNITKIHLSTILEFKVVIVIIYL